MIPFPGLPVDPAEAQASSTACCQVRVVTEPPFLVRASQTPGEVAWLADNQVRSASASATINSSSSALAMTGRLVRYPDMLTVPRPDRRPWPVAPASAGDRARAGSVGSMSLEAIGALREPVRRAVYEYVVARAEPVSRNEVAEATAIGRTLAAFHLEKLAEAGLLETAYAPRSGGPGAGRPAKLYRRSAPNTR